MIEYRLNTKYKPKVPIQAIQDENTYTKKLVNDGGGGGGSTVMAALEQANPCFQVEWTSFTV